MPLKYLPDADPRTPGVVTDMQYLLPTTTGYSLLPVGTTAGEVSVATPATTTAAKFWACNTSRAGARYFWCGPNGSNKVYENTQNLAAQGNSGNVLTTWSDITGTATVQSGYFQFESVGIVVLAATGSALQVSASPGSAFANLGGGAPNASLICKSTEFILAFNASGNGDDWSCSALGNYASWTPSLATQAATGNLTQTPGSVVACAAWRDMVIVWKLNSMYIGRYIGPPYSWGWTVFSTTVGAQSQASVAVTDDGVFWWSGADFMTYNGGNGPQSIGSGLIETARQSGLNQWTTAGPLSTATVFDCPVTAEQRSKTIFFGPYAYNYELGKWSKFTDICWTTSTSTAFRGYSGYTGGGNTADLQWQRLGAGHSMNGCIYYIDSTGANIRTFYPWWQNTDWTNSAMVPYLTTNDYTANDSTVFIDRVVPQFKQPVPAAQFTINVDMSQTTAVGMTPSFGADVACDATKLRSDVTAEAKVQRAKIKFSKVAGGAILRPEILDIFVRARPGGKD